MSRSENDSQPEDFENCMCLVLREGASAKSSRICEGTLTTPRNLSATTLPAGFENIPKITPLTQKETIIGRCLTATLHIPSTLVSRIHAKITRLSDGSYEITDHSSGNGVYLNGTKLISKQPYPLVAHDEIRLCPSHVPGISMTMETRNEHRALGPTSVTKRERSQTDINDSDDFRDEYTKRLRPIDVATTTRAPSRRWDENQRLHPEADEPRTMRAVDAPTTSAAANRNVDDADIISSSSSASQNVDDPAITIGSSSSACQISDNLATAISSSSSGACQISDNLATAISSSSSSSASQNVDDTPITVSSISQEVKSTIGTAVVENTAKSEKICQNISEDLVCSICSELFIKPTILNCSHTFCKACIEEWKRNHPECPMCRVAIKTMVFSALLNNIVSHVADGLSSAERQERDAVIEERLQTPAIPSDPPPLPPSPPPVPVTRNDRHVIFRHAMQHELNIPMTTARWVPNTRNIAPTFHYTMPANQPPRLTLNVRPQHIPPQREPFTLPARLTLNVRPQNMPPQREPLSLPTHLPQGWRMVGAPSGSPAFGMQMQAAVNPNARPPTTLASSRLVMPHTSTSAATTTLSGGGLASGSYVGSQRLPGVPPITTVGAIPTASTSRDSRPTTSLRLHEQPLWRPRERGVGVSISRSREPIDISSDSEDDDSSNYSSSQSDDFNGYFPFDD